MSNIFDLCAKYFTKQSQVRKLIEECLELSLELMNSPGIITKDDEGVISEIADVEIMIQQIKHTFNLYTAVADVKEQKLERIKSRINA